MVRYRVVFHLVFRTFPHEPTRLAMHCHSAAGGTSCTVQLNADDVMHPAGDRQRDPFRHIHNQCEKHREQTAKPESLRLEMIIRGV
jgi:hypothetical protein